VALIESTISFFCALTPSLYNGSCHKALEATSMNITVGQKVNAPADPLVCQRVFNQQNPSKEDIMACNKNISVIATNVSAKEEMNSSENKFQQYVLNQAYGTVGKNTVYTMGGIGYLYNAYTTKRVTFDIPNAKVCDSIHADVSPNSAGLRLQWNFK